MNERLWFTTAQAAARAERHEVTVRRALQAGELHGSQRGAGGRWRTHRDCIDAWVLGQPCPHVAAQAS